MSQIKDTAIISYRKLCCGRHECVRYFNTSAVDNALNATIAQHLKYVDCCVVIDVAIEY